MKQKGRRRFSILFLFLAFTLICSGSIYAQDLFNYNLNGNNGPGTVWNPTPTTSGGQIYRGEGAAYNPSGFVAPCSSGNYTGVPSCQGSPSTTALAQCNWILSRLSGATVTAATGVYQGGSLVCSAVVPPATTVGSYFYNFAGDWTNYYDYLNAQLKAESETAGNPGNSSAASAFVATEQCMSCHNAAVTGATRATGDQGDYLLTGHKNGFRKVVTNQPLHSSDGSQYTGITWGLNTPPTNSTGAQVYYNIAGWMSPGAAPDLVYVQGGSGGCAYCHVAGYSPVAQSDATLWGGVDGVIPSTWWQGFGSPALSVAPGPEPTQVIPATGVTITGISIATAGTQAPVTFTFTGTLPSQVATNSYVQLNGFTGSANDELLNGTIFQVSGVSAPTFTAKSTIPDSYYPAFSSTVTETGTMSVLSPIPANSTGVLRLPENSTTGDSSWYETGVTCERCHLAEAGANAVGTKTGSTHVTGSNCTTTTTYDQFIQGHEFTCVNGGQNLPLFPSGTGATELCMECHRLQVASTKGAQAITPLYPPVVKYAASTNTYSDGDYQGSEFLNSPHAQYLGTLLQNAQGSPDLSVNFTGALWAGTGTYYSLFQGVNDANATPNSGCTGCHDPHQTIVGLEYTGGPLASAPTAIQNANLLQPTTYAVTATTGVGNSVTYSNLNWGALMGSGPNSATGEGPTSGTTVAAYNCDNCHGTNGPGETIKTFTHSVGPGTPFPNSSSSVSPLDLPGACMVCHMEGSSGQPKMHFFRINPSATYYTYNTSGNYNATAAISAYSVAPTAVQFTTGAFTGGTAAAVGDEITVSGITTAGLTVLNNSYIVTGVGTGTFTASLVPLGSAATATISALSGGGVTGTATISAIPYNTYTPGDGEYTQALSTNQFINGGANAIGLDVDIACGQCHGGGTGNGVNPYGITGNTGPNFSRAYLASVAVGMHGTQVGPTLAAPTFTPPAGSYTTNQTVTLNDTTATATICYTTNGNTPTASVAGTCDSVTGEGSVTAGNSITVAAPSSGSNVELMAIATAVGDLNSPLAYGTYTINPSATTVAPPTFSLNAGTYTLKTSTSTLTDVLSDATSGATICYTTNGTTPTATVAGTCDSLAGETGVPSGTSLTIGAAETVMAIGTLKNYVNSNVASAAYSLIPSDPTFSPGTETFYQSYVSTSWPQVTLTTSTGATLLYCAIVPGQPACTPSISGLVSGTPIGVSCVSGTPPCDVILYANAAFGTGKPSGVSHAKYSIKPGDPPGTPHAATPTLSPTPGPITPCSNPAYTTQSTCVAAGDTWTPVSVTISDSSTGVCSIPTYTTQATCTGATPTAGIWTPDIPVICYTLDGAVPAVNAATGACTTGTLYTVPVPLNAVEGNIYTIRAVAGGTGYLQSEPIAKGEYIFR